MAIKLDTQMAGDVFKTELENALDKRGDTMEDGATLTLGKDPENDMDAATKKYIQPALEFIPGDYAIKSTFIYYNKSYISSTGIVNSIYDTIDLNYVLENESDSWTPLADGKYTLKMSLFQSPVQIVVSTMADGYGAPRWIKFLFDFEIILLQDGVEYLSLYKIENIERNCFLPCNNNNYHSIFIDKIMEETVPYEYEIPAKKGVKNSILFRYTIKKASPIKDGDYFYIPRLYAFIIPNSYFSFDENISNLYYIDSSCYHTEYLNISDINTGLVSRKMDFSICIGNPILQFE